MGTGTVEGLWVYRPVDPCNRSSGEYLECSHRREGVLLRHTCAAATSGCGGCGTATSRGGGRTFRLESRTKRMHESLFLR